MEVGELSGKNTIEAHLRCPNSYNDRTKIFRLHFCHRHYGFSYSVTLT